MRAFPDAAFAALTAARPSSAGEALKAASMPFAAADRLLQDGPEFVLDAGGGDARNIDQLAEAVAEGEGGHRGLQVSRLAYYS